MPPTRIATILALLLLAACHRLPSGLVPIDTGLAAYVPSDAVMLAGVRLDALRDTATYKRLEQTPALSQFDDFKQRTGLDPRKDLSELLAASTGSDWIVMCRGRFNPAALEDQAVKDGAKRMAHGKFSMVGDEGGAIVFVDSSTALAGKPAVLKAALDRRSGIPAPLVEKLKTVPPESQLWFVATGGVTPPMDPGKSSGPINPQNLARLFGSLQSISASGDFRIGLSFKAAGVCATEQDAKQIYDTLRGFIGLGRLSARGDQADLLRLYDSIAVTLNERTVNVRADLPLDLIERLPAMPRQGD